MGQNKKPIKSPLHILERGIDAAEDTLLICQAFAPSVRRLEPDDQFPLICIVVYQAGTVSHFLGSGSVGKG